MVGSIAFDAVKTPFGEREQMLGGAATHFALAASFFVDEVHAVGPVGDDFGEAEHEVLARARRRHRRHRARRGRQDVLLGRRVRLRPQLARDARHRPQRLRDVRAQAVATPRRNADVLFLANIQPDLQLQVREQCSNARFVAMDSMDLWIDIARDSLVKVDRDRRRAAAQRRRAQAAHRQADPRRRRRARSWRWGPKVVVAKQGEYGAALFTESGFFALPAYPLETAIDPTGAGDSFAGGFMGYLAAHADEIDDAHLRRAMAYGTAVASFNVEDFGTERVARLTAGEISDRVAELARITHFEDAPIELRA